MDKQKQIEEMAEEKNSKQWQRRDKYCLRIQKATQYKGDCDHEDVPSILVDYEEEIKKELIPENAVVLTQEEWATVHEQFAQAMYQKEVHTRKETAEKFAERLKERFNKSREYYEIDTGTAWSDGHIGGLINDEIDKICKEFTEGNCKEQNDQHR